MYVPVRPCEELLNNQFDAGSHPTHATDSSNGAADSWTLVVATHNRTAEAAASLHAACEAAAATPPRSLIVFIDEADSDRQGTESELSALYPNAHFLHGDGSTYWSRSLLALLMAALAGGSDYIVHINTDVTLTNTIDRLLDPMREDDSLAAVGGWLTGDTRITGYKPVHAWFPFFRAVDAGREAAILPASCVAFRASALRSIDLSTLDLYRHGFADIELSIQLRRAGYRLTTSQAKMGEVEHRRYFRRRPQFAQYGGSLLRFVRDCPTAPCFADTKRAGRRLFGHAWPVLLRVYLPVIWHWVGYRIRRVRAH